MTKKQLNRVVSGLVNQTLGKIHGFPRETTKEDEEEARTLLGMTLRTMQDEIVNRIPVAVGATTE